MNGHYMNLGIDIMRRLYRIDGKQGATN